VAALQTMFGMALVNAATLIAELRDLSRFANPAQLMAYLGLVSSEYSSGANIKRGGLINTGNSAAASPVMRLQPAHQSISTVVMATAPRALSGRASKQRPEQRHAFTRPLP